MELYQMIMVKKNKLLSLLIVILMMAVATISVKKAIFGIDLEKHSDDQSTYIESDIITFRGDTTVIHTADLQSTWGYAGPVPLDIYIMDGKIASIEALPNDETLSFFRRAAVILDSWSGKTPEEALDLKVDAITGATYSSMAIIANVNAGLAYYLGSPAQKRHPEAPLRIWIALAITLGACIIPLFVKNKLYYNVQLATNVIVLGFWCGQYLDYASMLKLMSGEFSFPIAIIAIVMLVAAFIYPIFGRPQHYCNYICPLGAAQQLAAGACHYKIHLSPRLLKVLTLFRKVLWATLLLLLWLDCLTEWIDFELFQAFQVKSAPWWIIAAAGLFVALSAVIARPYCRFVCPTGSLFKRAEGIVR